MPEGAKSAFGMFNYMRTFVCFRLSGKVAQNNAVHARPWNFAAMYGIPIGQKTESAGILTPQVNTFSCIKVLTTSASLLAKTEISSICCLKPNHCTPIIVAYVVGISTLLCCRYSSPAICIISKNGLILVPCTKTIMRRRRSRIGDLDLEMVYIYCV